MHQMLYVAALSAGAFATLFALTKVMGNREMSQLSMFDYINGITIGSIAAEMATSLSDDFTEPLVAMIVFGLLSLLMAVLTSKSIAARRVFTGRPAILLENGELYRKNLARSHLDLNEFMTQCRINGYFDLNDIHTAILETNGRISFLPAAARRPATPSDMSLSPPQKSPLANVIIDGNIMRGNLRHTGNDEIWLMSRLAEHGVYNVSDVFLATCGSGGELTVYKNTGEKTGHDIFQ